MVDVELQEIVKVIVLARNDCQVRACLLNLGLSDKNRAATSWHKGIETVCQTIITVALHWIADLEDSFSHPLDVHLQSLPYLPTEKYNMLHHEIWLQICPCELVLCEKPCFERRSIIYLI